MNSTQVDLRSNVPIPNYGYFSKTDSDKIGKDAYLSTFKKNLEKTCANVSLESDSGVSGGGFSVISNETYTKLYNEQDDYKKKIMDGIRKTDADNMTALIAAGIQIESIDTSPSSIQNQLKYLGCQVAQMHAREYNPDEFPQNMGTGTIKNIFDKFATYKPYLIVIFILSIYLFVQGVFGSMDIGYNIVQNLFRSEVGNDMGYWAGLLIGVAVPFIFTVSIFADEICKTLEKQNKIDITNNPYGSEDKPEQSKNLDYMMVVFFVLVIYGFMGVLYQFGSTGNTKFNAFNLFIIMGVLILISFFMYFFYSYTPFLTTGSNESSVFSRQPYDFKLYITKKSDVDTITSNQNMDVGIKKMFLTIAIVIYVLALVFFKINQVGAGMGGVMGGFLRGLTGAGAILVLPIIWVGNIVLSIQYFYIYPILILLLRGVRYFGTLMLYNVINSRGLGDTIRETMSDEFSEMMNAENLKNYSGSWGLVGVSLLKTWMNFCGFENRLSKELVENSNSQKNLSEDKYVTSLFFGRYSLKDEKNGTDIKMIMMIIVITIIMSMSILGNLGLLTTSMLNDSTS